MNCKKLFCLSLAAILAVAAISCTKEKPKNNASTGNAVTNQPDKFTENLHIEDYEGYNFRILTRKGHAPQQYIEEETGNIIDDAVFKRNETVKQLLNIEISTFETISATANTEAVSSILAGDDQYDVILTHSRSAFQYAIQNTLINYNEIETLHLDSPWWFHDIVDSCNVNGHLYVLDGDIQTSGLGSAMCMYFNKTLFDELGFEYPYQMVLDNEWTFDEFTKLVKKGTKDLNGDGVITPESDRYGWLTSDWQSPISFLYTTGVRIYDKDARGIPTLTLNSQKTVDFFSEYFDLVDSDDVLLTTQENSGGVCVNYTGPNLFTEGRALFYDAGLGQAQSMRAMSDDFGIVPNPKFSEDDKYATVVNGAASLLLMPITVEDENRTGSIIEALCAIGSKEVIPAFYEVSLKTKFARDAESEQMIDIIRDSIMYDLGYVAGGTFQSIGYDLAHSGGEFSSTYAANESAALVKLQEFNKSYGKIG